MNIFTIFAPIIDFVLRFFLKKRNRPRLERPVPTSFLSKKNDRFFHYPLPHFSIGKKQKKNVFSWRNKKKFVILYSKNKRKTFLWQNILIQRQI